MRRLPHSVGDRMGDRSWVVALVALAVATSGVAARVGAQEPAATADPLDPAIVCEEPGPDDPTAPSTTTTTTTTTIVPDSTIAPVCPDDPPATDPTEPPTVPTVPAEPTTEPTVPAEPTTVPVTTGPSTSGPSTSGPSTSGPAPSGPAISDPAISDPANTGPAGTGPTTTRPSAGSSTTTAAPGPDTSSASDVAPTSPALDDATAATASTAAAPPTTEPDVGLPELPAAPPEDWPVRQITFPVAGPVTYYDDWGACRGGAGCPRHHIGNDIIGLRLQPLIAASDGVVSHLVLDHPTAGWGLVIKDSEGWEYRYYHVNNDAPGTDDGSDPPEWRLAAGIAEGTAVRAGQVVAYMGDSGNSETSVPHVHFEIHRPDGSPIDPYRSLRFSEWTTRCSDSAAGPEQASALAPAVNAAMADAVVPTSTGRGRFLLSLDGSVLALGDADAVGWSRHIPDDPVCPPAPAEAPVVPAAAAVPPAAPVP